MAADAALHTAQQARLALTAAAQDSSIPSTSTNVSAITTDLSSPAAAFPANSVQDSAAQQTAVLSAHAGDASPAGGASPAVDVGASTHLSTAASSTPRGLPQPANTSTMSVGSAVLAAMMRGLSWKSSGNLSGPGTASHLSRGGSGHSSGDYEVERASRASSSILGAGRVSRAGSGASSRSPGSRKGSGTATAAAVPAGVPLGEGKEGDTIPPAGVPDTTVPSGHIDGADIASMLRSRVGLANGATAAVGDFTQLPTAGAAAAAPGELPSISSADMRYLAHDRALIDSLSEDSMCDMCETTTTQDAAACTTGSSSGSKLPPPATAAATAGLLGAAGVAAPNDEVTADTNDSSTRTKGRFTVTERRSIEYTALPAADGAVGSNQGNSHIRPADMLHLGAGRLHGSTVKAASERGLRRQQLLLRAEELDSEAASHAAAAAEAGRMAEVYVAESAEVEGVLRVEVTQERRKLLSRQEVSGTVVSVVYGGQDERGVGVVTCCATWSWALHRVCCWSRSCRRGADL